MKAARDTSAPAESARDRLLGAAEKVFARDGLAGATTRAIAKEAGVNEVTLFRCFGTKQRLLDEVVERNFGAAVPAEQELVLADTGDLAADLQAFAEGYDQRLAANLPLIRTFIGEIQHHKEHEHMVLRGIFRPLREALIKRFAAEIRRRKVRPAPVPELLADLFTGMLFAGALRRTTLYLPREYTVGDYNGTVVRLVLAELGVR